MKMAEKLNWIKIDMSDKAIASAFDDAKVAYQNHATLKAFAEQLVIDKADLPETHTLKFGYLYGPPAFAIVEVTEPKAKKPAKGALTPQEMGAAFKKLTGITPQSVLIKKVA
jgi:hypothetical protein